MRLSRPCLAGACFPGAYRAQGPEGLSIAAGHRPGGFQLQDCQSVRIYASEQCPRQDSNLRSRLRRALHHLAVACGNVPTGDPSGHVLGTGQIARRSRPCRPPLISHKPRSDRHVSLTLHPIYRTGCGGGWRAMRKPARVTEARLALGRRLAILRHDAGALNPIQFRPAPAATNRPGRAGPLSWP
jgi:hypothetical protein